MIDRLLQFGIELVERGSVPDSLTRRVIRHLCSDRLNDPLQTVSYDRDQARTEFLRSLREGPIALVPDKANEQHYELPPQFFGRMLGPHRKYSCCYFSHDRATLAQAEEESLSITCQRAVVADGQSILELGCGWGSLSLWIAQRFPNCRITAVSNSTAQRRYIEAVVASMGIDNLQVVTADMNDLVLPGNSFDRVLSIEMFEHMRNYRELLRRIRGWLKPDGRLFVHVFCHRQLLYPFETEGSGNWMGRYFFTGGLMPSADLFQSFTESLQVIDQWSWDGTHYQRTAEAWLKNLDLQRTAVTEILQSTYGIAEGRRWFQRWRMFLLAVSELFGYAGGSEWYVTQCLFQPVKRSGETP